MTDPLISDYLAWLAERRKSPRTIDLRYKILSRMDNDLPQGLVQATADEIKTWIYRPQWSKKTLCTYYEAPRAFFDWACGPYSPETLSHNPMGIVVRPDTPHHLPRPVTRAQLETAVRQAVEPFRLWVVLAAWQGLRCIEIAALLREQITETELLVASGKGDKPAVLPTHPMTWQAVRNLPPGHVARNKTGGPTNAHYLSTQASAYLRELLGEPVTLHQFRHWFGTEVYRQTRDLRKTQELLRHASPTTAARYTEITGEERRAAIQTLPTITGS